MRILAPIATRRIDIFLVVLKIGKAEADTATQNYSVSLYPPRLLLTKSVMLVLADDFLFRGNIHFRSFPPLGYFFFLSFS